MGENDKDFVERRQASQAKIDIQKAAEEAKLLITDAAREASQVISNATAEALRLRGQDNADHDLLVELKTETRVKLDALFMAVKEIKDGFALRIENLEKCKVDIQHSYPTVYKPEVDKQFEVNAQRLNTQSKRIDGLSKLVYIGLGIVLAIQLVALVIIPLLKR